MIFGYFMAISRWPMLLAESIASLHVPVVLVSLGIALVYLILGCFMDTLAMVFLTVPIFYPVILRLGLDPIWFGVLIVGFVETGLITPPVGMNLFVVKSMAEDVPMEKLYRAVLPYVLTIVAFMVALVVFPRLVLWVIAPQ